MDINNYCSSCLCSDRDLVSIAGSNLFAIYHSILKEIPQYNTCSIHIHLRLCYECWARVRNFEKFKCQAKRSYTELYIAQRTTNSEVAKEFQLQAHLVHNFSYDCVGVIDNTDCRIETSLSHDDKPLLKQEKIDIDIDTIKCEQNYLSDSYDGHYSEPETFTKQLDLINPNVKLKKKSKKEKKKKGKQYNFVIESDEELNLKQLKEKKYNNEVFIEMNKEPFDCKDCSLVFDNEKELILHIKGHKKSQHACDICSLQFSSKSALKQHAKEHSQSQAEPPAVTETHSCELCNDNFPSLDKLQLHKIRVHKQRPECTDCGKVFSSRKTYRYHIKVIHKGHNRFPCPQCGKVYQWKSNLWRHLKNHKARDSGELYCVSCDRKFSSVATYQHHLRLSKSHVTENAYSFVCSECGKKFVNKTRLRDHENWDHLKQVNYRCHKCDKPFKSSTSLYVHLHNVHKDKDQKDNLCHVCGKSYQNIAKLKYHIVAMHTSAQPYACSVCHASFSWYSSLYRHTRDLHHKIKIKKLKKEKKESDCGE